MKNFKSIFSSFLLCLLVGYISVSYAGNADNLPNYKNVVSNISLDYEGALLGGTIELNNGQILRIVDYKFRDDNALKTWKAGDEVKIEPHVKNDALLLAVKGPKDVEPYVVYDAINSPKNGLKIVEVTQEGKFIKLTDNSVWEFGWYNRFSTQKWKVGQLVTLQRKGDSNSYEFINFDIPAAENSSYATASFVTH